MKMSLSKTHFFLLLLLTLVITDGCIYYSMKQRSFFKKNVLEYFDKAEGGIDKLINIDGYYVTAKPEKYSGGKLSSSFSFIFFNDGSFSLINWREDPPIFAGVPNISLSEHQRKVINCRMMIEILWKKRYELTGGVYVLNEDTIFTEYDDMDGALIRYNFKVKDRNTIVLISSEFIYDIHGDFREESYDDMKEEYRTLKFVPAHDLPSPVDMYNKNKRYRWSDRLSWRNYKSQRREYFHNKRKQR